MKFSADHQPIAVKYVYHSASVQLAILLTSGRASSGSAATVVRIGAAELFVDVEEPEPYESRWLGVSEV